MSEEKFLLFTARQNMTYHKGKKTTFVTRNFQLLRVGTIRPIPVVCIVPTYWVAIFNNKNIFLLNLNNSSKKYGIFIHKLIAKNKKFWKLKFSYPFSNLDSTSEILTFWPVINRCETNNLWKFIDEYCKLVYYNRSNLKQVAKVIWVMSNGCPKLLVRKVPTRE